MWESLLGVDFTGQWHSRAVQVDGIYWGHWDIVVFLKDSRMSRQRCAAAPW